MLPFATPAMSNTRPAPHPREGDASLTWSKILLLTLSPTLKKTPLAGTLAVLRPDVQAFRFTSAHAALMQMLKEGGTA
jgi:hypothetical protein